MLTENQDPTMFEIKDFGLSEYGETLALQQACFNNLIESKKRGERGKEIIFIGEHYPVITLGRRAKYSNILESVEYLENNGIGLYHIGRGGDVTYHCPGQIILYPVIDLEMHKLGVKDYVGLLEESVILLLEKYGIKGERVEGATGVWIDNGKPRERKISAIGIKCSRYCTMHGLSLNVAPELSGFQLINPCGFIDKGVTSMEIEVGKAGGDKSLLDIGRVKKELLHIFFSLIFPFEEVFHFPE